MAQPPYYYTVNTGWTNAATTGTFCNWNPVITYTQAPPAVPAGPLAWLDAEIERTCALARP